MMARGKAFEIAQRDPTPDPGSGPKRRFAVEDAPPELQDNFLVRYFASLTVEEQVATDATLARRIEAAERYGDDAERELADLQAGLHPLHRRTTETG